MTLQEAYTRGFCKAAEACGVDPEKLVKVAWNSTPLNEVLLSLPTGIIPYLGTGATAAGSLSGSISDPTEEQRSAWKNLLPGVGAHRLANRMKTQALEEYRKHGVDALGHMTAENIGSTTSPLVGGLLGGLLGAGGGALSGLGKDQTTRRKHMAAGAMIGAVLGGVLPGLGGAIAAAIKRRRTEGEQVEHDRGSHAVQNFLVPGYATYNKYKRLGRSQGDRDEKKQKSDK